MVNVKVSEQEYKNFLVRMASLFEGNHFGNVTMNPYRPFYFDWDVDGEKSRFLEGDS